MASNGIKWNQMKREINAKENENKELGNKLSYSVCD
jgi:hypothetical protein